MSTKNIPTTSKGVFPGKDSGYAWRNQDYDDKWGDYGGGFNNWTFPDPALPRVDKRSALLRASNQAKLYPRIIRMDR